MKKICSWCGADLDLGRAPAPQGGPVTHGICPKCRDLMIRKIPGSLAALLDQFDMPILLVDENAVAQGANIAACKALGRDRASVTGFLAGDLTMCAHARQPGGCGKTVHCAGCQVRLSVTRTHQTGESLSNIDAYQDVETDLGVRRRHLRISTEKVGEFVLLQIDEM
jgi:PAS domain-containing protein